MARHVLAWLAALQLAAATASAQSLQIECRDGSRWRGTLAEQVSVTVDEQGALLTFEGRLVEVEDSYIVVECTVLGASRRKVFFKGDLVSMGKADPGPVSSMMVTGDVDPTEVAPTAALPGVLVLPLEGEVGIGIRPDEIEAIGEEADRQGRGQIIVLVIETNGGFVRDLELVLESLRDLRRRHRVVAWVEKAIAGGAAIAMACDEIYFMTDGTAGSLINGEKLPGLESAVLEIARENKYSVHVARAMIHNDAMCSYDKDPETGVVTFHGDLSGRYILSDDHSSLCFNSSSAEHCGFSRGTADTESDLAPHLDLPRWHEVSDHGRRIAKEWQRTVEQAQERIARLVVQRNYDGTSGGQVERLGTLIRIDKELLRWWERAPQVASKMLPPPEDLKREIEELRRELGRLRSGG
jgi:hypothetical protein